MLEILHNGKALNLPPDIQISLTIENPLLKQDRIPTPYSLSFELPPTRHNLEQFGWPDRIGTYRAGRFVRTIPVDIRFHSITIGKGHLKLTSYLDSLKVTFSGIDYIDGIKSKLYELDFGREEFPGAYWGPILFNNDLHFAYWYKEWANSAVFGDRDDFVLAPIAILDESMPFTRFEPAAYQWSGNTSDEYRFRSVYRYQDSAFFNLYNPWKLNHLISRELTNNYTVAVSHANVFPLFRVGHIFKTILGSVLENNMFLQGDLRNLVMPTFYYRTWTERLEIQATDHTFNNREFPPMVENPRPAWNEDYPSRPYIEYKNYMPDFSANEFLKTMLNMFCMSLFPYKGKLQLRQNGEVLNRPATISWSDKLIGDPEILTEGGKVYNYGYPGVDPYKGAEQFVTVATVWAMAAYPYSLDGDGTYEGFFSITETGQRFAKRVQRVDLKVVGGSGATHDFSQDEVSYELLDTGLSVEKREDVSEKYNVEPPVQPLPLYPAIGFWSMENDTLEYANTFGMTVPAVSVDRKQRQETIPLLFHKGWRAVPSDTSKTYPYASIYPDSNNNLSLLWNGPNGLIEKYHKHYMTWVEQDKLRLKGTFLLNAVDLHQLDLGNKVHVNGRNFFVDKIQITLRARTIDPAVIDLIEA